MAFEIYGTVEIEGNVDFKGKSGMRPFIFESFILMILKYFNYNLIDFDLLNEKNIFKLCKFDYPSLFEVILKSGDINVNSKIKLISKKAKMINQERKGRRWYFEDHFEHDVYRFYFKEEEKTALTMAIENERIGIVHLLMTVKKLDVNIKSTEKLWWKIDFDELDEEEVNEYIQTKEDEWYKSEEATDDEEKKEKVTEKTQLHLAICNNNEEIVNLLLSRSEIDTNQKSVFRKWKWVSDECRRFGHEKTYEEETTPLYKAIEIENVNIVNQLISESKIDMNALSLIKYVCIDTEKHIWKTLSCNDLQKSALHEACEKSNFDIVKLLISRNDIDINEKLIKSEIYTNYQSDFDNDFYQIHNWTVDKLLDDIENNQDKNKNNSDSDSDSGSNKNVKINERTALDVAVRKKNQKICNFLRNNKAIEIDIQSEEERYREEQENLVKERMKDGCSIQ